MKKTPYIDPIIGTVGDEQGESYHGGGKTHPGATYPFGMVQFSPDTTTSGDNGTGYNYCQSTIEGFSVNHMSGIGWYGDLGNLQIMPVCGKTDLRSGSNDEIPFTKGSYGWKSEFSHERERARAGYYSVMLDRYGILAEATVSSHAGIFRFTYPKSDTGSIIFNFSRRIAGHADFQRVNVIGRKIEGEIICTPAGGGFGRGHGGISYRLYFSLELSKDFGYSFFENEEFLTDGIKNAEGEDLHLLATFNTEEKEQVFVRCGISYVDLDGARNNLSAECPDFDFDGLYKKADDAWERALDIATVEGENETDLTLYYTCLYHALLDPRTAVDCDGRYVNPNGEICNASYQHRTMFSGWDVYRSEFPLLTIIDPVSVNDQINTLLSIADAKKSSLPRWELMGIDSHCMVGDPGLIVLCDAFLKGISDFNVNRAYEICKSSALSTYTGGFKSFRPQCEQYKKDAFIPHCLSETLEYLLADYCLAQMAKGLGYDKDYEFFMSRAMSYGDNFNKDSGFMSARDENGNFVPVKDEYDGYGCVESNIFQQSWFVPYDVLGLCNLFGKERSVALLERLFDKAVFSRLWNEDYNHSNEPCHNITHYFNILGLPKRTQYWTRRVQKEAYRTGAFGFCGNEDVGQLSAWYVLSALGFAQICMCEGKYYINTPLFKKATLTLNSKYHACTVSNRLTIECDRDPLEFPYISAVYLNGKKTNRTYLTYEEITGGGEIKFELTKE